MVNIRLKKLIIEAELPQYRLGEIIGVHETRVSQIVHLRVRPTDEEKAKIAKALNVPVADIFPESDH